MIYFIPRWPLISWVLDLIGLNSWVCNGHQSHCHHSRGIFWSWLWPEGQRHRPTHRTERSNTEVRNTAVRLYKDLVSCPAVYCLCQEILLHTWRFFNLVSPGSKVRCGWVRNILCPWWSRWPPSLTSWLGPAPILLDYETLWPWNFLLDFLLK